MVTTWTSMNWPVPGDAPRSRHGDDRPLLAGRRSARLTPRGSLPDGPRQLVDVSLGVTQR